MYNHMLTHLYLIRAPRRSSLLEEGPGYERRMLGRFGLRKFPLAVAGWADGFCWSTMLVPFPQVTHPACSSPPPPNCCSPGCVNSSLATARGEPIVADLR